MWPLLPLLVSGIVVCFHVIMLFVVLVLVLVFYTKIFFYYFTLIETRVESCVLLKTSVCCGMWVAHYSISNYCQKNKTKKFFFQFVSDYRKSNKNEIIFKFIVKQIEVKFFSIYLIVLSNWNCHKLARVI